MFDKMVLGYKIEISTYYLVRHWLQKKKRRPAHRLRQRPIDRNCKRGVEGLLTLLKLGIPKYLKVFWNGVKIFSRASDTSGSLRDTGVSSVVMLYCRILTGGFS